MPVGPAPVRTMRSGTLWKHGSGSRPSLKCRSGRSSQNHSRSGKLPSSPRNGGLHRQTHHQRAHDCSTSNCASKKHRIFASPARSRCEGYVESAAGRADGRMSEVVAAEFARRALHPAPPRPPLFGALLSHITRRGRMPRGLSADERSTSAFSRPLRNGGEEKERKEALPAEPGKIFANGLQPLSEKRPATRLDPASSICSGGAERLGPRWSGISVRAKLTMPSLSARQIYRWLATAHSSKVKQIISVLVEFPERLRCAASFPGTLWFRRDCDHTVETAILRERPYRLWARVGGAVRTVCASVRPPARLSVQPASGGAARRESETIRVPVRRPEDTGLRSAASNIAGGTGGPKLSSK